MIPALLILALLGLGDSLYLLSKKLKKEKIFCLVGEDCNKVVESSYGKVLGIPNEVFGAVFYLGTAGGALLLWQGAGAVFGVSVHTLLRVSALAAVAASAYLLSVQFAVLKARCSWCMASALINILILFVLFV